LLPDPSTTAIYTLSLHDALPIFRACADRMGVVLRDDEAGQRDQPADVVGEDVIAGHLGQPDVEVARQAREGLAVAGGAGPGLARSEEHTSELQSRSDLVCRLLLE